MSTMNLQEIHEKIAGINDYLGKCLWMDFEVTSMNGGEIILSGCIDQSYNDYAIEIEFKSPYFVSTLFSRHTDASVPFISLANEEEFVEMNVRYRVEEGNYIFKINVEDYEKTPIYIGASKIDYRIINTEPFA
ncbi:hypothetical protein HCC18_04170 [Listeria booriae]|uniref:hypothetical protein n=1 Tax=Listeria booriae TaxID=1552123 RepID=UPI001626FA48|nr:hypothetical protein [Listeria booriae]MBC2316025.1 hypothetical protein [Listeria booriae]